MFYMRGICKGIKVTPNKDPNKQPTITAGVGVPVHNGFEGQERVFELRFFPEQIRDALYSDFKTLQGKQIEVAFTIGEPRQFNNKMYQDYNCAGKPVELKAANVEPLKPAAVAGAGAK